MPVAGRTQGFRVGELGLLLCNVEDEPYVVRDECSHARTPLSGGRLCGFVLECPLHGGKIDVRDGAPAAPPVRRPVQAFPVRRNGDQIEVGLATAGAPPAATAPPRL